MQVAAEMARQYMRGASIGFGDIVNIPADSTTDVDMRSVKDRPPTPVVRISALFVGFFF